MSLWRKLYLLVYIYWILSMYRCKGRSCDGYDGPILGVCIDYDKARITVYGPEPGTCPTLIKWLSSCGIAEVIAGTKRKRA